MFNLSHLSLALAANILGIDPFLSLYAIAAFVLIGVSLTSLILFTKAKFVASEECEIKVNSDSDLTKHVLSGSTLLQALSSNGIPVPSPCGGKATCKQCRVRIVEGADEPLETDRGTFNKRELKEGWRLSCQAKVKHDLHILVDEHSLAVKEWKAKVVSNKNVATFIKELVVEIPAGEEVPYKSGGYLQFHVPPFKTNTTDWKETMDPLFYADWEKFNLFDKTLDFSHLPSGSNEIIRAYSMASYPAEGRKLMFNIRIATPPFVGGKISDSIPWGICSSYTFGLKPGDEVRLSGPYGESFMINDNRELVFLIGGAGSSFGRSHILHMFHTENTQRKVSMWYGARSLKENIYQKEYEELAQKYPNFAYHLVLSEPLPEDLSAGWPKEDPIKTNYLFKAFELGQLSKMESPEECLFYVCGPPMHNISVLKLLDDYGVPRKNIVLDDFGS
ncbi:NADH:ubiquinone reductase (Na(+)-transporting) subunit F [Parachlamydia sp. AcF125]|uniref:NADH:ubiquinone reductase (Na(+)-transporting) subunit F n=1 Tax=Parachlamydia sp. AcF125 TaxID=2795736 RepID=UPI001BC8D8F3|nr:NADH:ubiquinone reductase (Na(+)-transporting) subunit F [Parachlamydia sp. AcF125]MBS4168049.1 Na(+)-translocating NADH-quinone reductase subunit F [Parachlamydia sp. AcF125]